MDYPVFRIWITLACYWMLLLLPAKVFSLSLPSKTSTTTTTPPTTDSLLFTIPQVFEKYQTLSEGKHWEERVQIQAIVQEIKSISPRLVFLRVCQIEQKHDTVSTNNMIEILLKERDGFLSMQEIASITQALQQHPLAVLQCTGFPEKMSYFDGPTFFPHLQWAPEIPLCLHAVALMVTSPEGHVLVDVRERTTPPTTTLTTTLPLWQRTKIPQRRTNPSRAGGGNRDRGSFFAAWALEIFDLQAHNQPHILDVAGGSGQLAFQLGVRRGLNVTVVDPRSLRLASNQQRTLHYHRSTGLRMLPPGRNVDRPLAEYGHHFAQAPNTNNSHDPTDQTWLVGGQARVRHLAAWFNPEFRTHPAWKDATVVLGMHPDEPSEDMVDMALADGKPFAIVPCCVFWKRDPHRQTPTGEPVRTWEQFCEYLAAKDTEQIKVTSLPFPGRNVVLYSLGRSKE